jgi:hypothetical protein
MARLASARLSSGGGFLRASSRHAEFMSASQRDLAA